MKPTIQFKRNTRSVFFHITTQCNLSCKHCYIDPEKHGAGEVPLESIIKWLDLLKQDNTDLVLLGGEPTLHPELSSAIKYARKIGYRSITVDTNGYLFCDILNKVTPNDVDFFSFSLDGPDASTNDCIRGKGAFDNCIQGIHAARKKGFSVSLIYTVSAMNIQEIRMMPSLIATLDIQKFFIQIIGIRGKSAHIRHKSDLQVSYHDWITHIPEVAMEVANLDVDVTYPKVFLAPEDTFECAGRVSEHFFVFPNGRVYQCPLCEDYPIHSYCMIDHRLNPMPPINEKQLFYLDIPEGCVMNKLIQPGNISYDTNGVPNHRIACCLLKTSVENNISKL
jgi:MoaA/NifB/PqqE/SkfB family radical SAM enzyme